MRSPIIGLDHAPTDAEREAIVAACYRDFNAHLSRFPDPARPDADGEAVEFAGQGWVLEDVRGRKFLDFLGGFGIFNLGHRHPRVVAAVQAQLDRLPLHSQWLRNPVAAEAARRLAEISPGPLARTFFCNSGAESVEGALKLAKLATGRGAVVSTENSFHGKTLGALSVTGRERFRKPIEPLLPGVRFVRYGDAEALERALAAEPAAAFIVEPVQGEGGVIVPPEGYLRAARAACDRHGALLIADEVQTGLGRTGRTWGVDHDGVTPDIMCLGKALGGGVVPCAAFHSTDALWRAWHPMPLFHTSTFGANPLATAAAAATVQVLVDERLAERAAETGARLLAGLRDLAARHEAHLIQARGRGLLLALETRDERTGTRVAQALFSRGVLTAYTLNNPRVLRFEPPLITPAEVIDDALGRIDDALRSL